MATLNKKCTCKNGKVIRNFRTEKGVRIPLPPGTYICFDCKWCANQD